MGFLKKLMDNKIALGSLLLTAFGTFMYASGSVDEAKENRKKLDEERKEEREKRPNFEHRHDRPWKKKRN